MSVEEEFWHLHRRNMAVWRTNAAAAAIAMVIKTLAGGVMLIFSALFACSLGATAVGLWRLRKLRKMWESVH